MKKLSMILILLLCLSILLSACEPKDTAGSSVPPESTAAPVQTTAPLNTTVPEGTPGTTLPEYVPGSIKLSDQDSDVYEFERKYRDAYYTIWGDFLALLTDDERTDEGDWFVSETERTNYGELQDEMLLVSFIKRYNITREEFDRAVDSYVASCNRMGWDITYEEYEVPNGDIIYTFDNEIINYYYRYE